jgi:ribonucleoside-triphosphate reductase
MRTKSKMMLGAQRALQFGGPQLLRKNAKMYNCVSSYADRAAFFGEFMWLLLCGAGAGFSVQRHHVAKLPALRDRKKSVKRFVVPDSIEGWAQAFDVLFSSFFVGGGKHPEFEAHPVWFDLSQIRPKGAKISGGFKAPGPEPLQHALTKVELLLSKVKNGTQLRPIEVYDACMYMADAVISGGVRRSATICLFSKDDEEMIRAKTGSWFQDNPQRGRSNNSVMLLRDEVTFEEFQAIMKSVEDSGEPGFIFTDSLEFTFNPCVEIGKLPVTEDGTKRLARLQPVGNQRRVCDTPEKFYRACYVASALCTLQAGYTDFEFLGPESKEIFEREALIGVSITGWMNNPQVLFDDDCVAQGREDREGSEQEGCCL